MIILLRTAWVAPHEFWTLKTRLLLLEKPPLRNAAFIRAQYGRSKLTSILRPICSSAFLVHLSPSFVLGAVSDAMPDSRPNIYQRYCFPNYRACCSLRVHGDRPTTLSIASAEKSQVWLARWPMHKTGGALQPGALPTTQQKGCRI